jgi:DNA-binding NarL/FixJ family response regulator
VLIVDDVAQVRQSLRTVLTLAGDIEIVGEAGDGLEAIGQAQALRPEVVVMDLEMPVMDGYEATRRIKAVCPACRVVALTIHAAEAERQQALQAGMADVVVKGAPLEVLLRAIWAAAADGGAPTGAST